MKDPSLVGFKHIPMEGQVRNINSSIVRHESQSLTERKLPIKHGADVLHAPIIILAELLLVVIRVGGTSMKRQVSGGR